MLLHINPIAVTATALSPGGFPARSDSYMPPLPDRGNARRKERLFTDSGDGKWSRVRKCMTQRKGVAALKLSIQSSVFRQICRLQPWMQRGAWRTLQIDTLLLWASESFITPTTT